ncbi:CcdC protein domain-containing protein [Kutzneria kofuensis]|uniref:DUF1453 domain-containing protein n=1 Tax=Kutzneria kofuensis TaxID=103725 RepID=A0A7W9KEV7_9PSEU|nr:CcdC protein domain-containing protein [Kutzneria kofuensis]MBB5891347.1 hypothetical protein [Kutzneria kofuensis]
MRDGLFLSGIILAIVLTTQIGRHRAWNWILILPFLTCSAGGVAALVQMKLTVANVLATLVALAVGALIGRWLITKMQVERSPKNGKFYTRCGLVYLSIWVGVFAVRAGLQYLMDTVKPIADGYNSFRAAVDLGADQFFNFFLFVVLSMIVVRTIEVWKRKAAIKRAEAAEGVPVRV